MKRFSRKSDKNCEKERETQRGKSVCSIGQINSEVNADTAFHVLYTSFKIDVVVMISMLLHFQTVNNYLHQVIVIFCRKNTYDVKISECCFDNIFK